MLRRKFFIFLIVFTFLLAFVGFLIELQTKVTGILILSFVILGTGYDFLGSIIGAYTRNSKIILFFTKTRFSFANFGVLFTPMSALFVLERFLNYKISKFIVSNYLYLLIFSLFTGFLFFFTKYYLKEEADILTYKLDRSDRFTSFVFILRRIVLVFALFITLVALIEGLKTHLYVWTILFSFCFIVTVPLNILHKNVSAAFVEVSTLVILLYGAYTYI